jgi:hypothetical protein
MTVMEIHFACSCGQKIWTDEALAGRTAFCPRCGDPLQVPAPQGPSSVALALENKPRNYFPARIEEQDTYPLLESGEDGRSPYEVDQLRLLEERLRRKAKQLVQDLHRRLEISWWQCLGAPCQIWKTLLGLAGGFASFLAFTNLLKALPGNEWAFWVASGLFLLYISGLMHRIFSGAMAGEAGVNVWPGAILTNISQSTLLCLVCWLAGPFFPSVVAGWFWLHSGPLGDIDWLILGQLTFLAFGSWFLLWATVLESGSLLRVHPRAVVRLVRRIRYRLLLGAMVGYLLAVVHGWGFVTSVVTLHRDSFSGWFFLTMTLTSGLYWFVFLLRWMGLCCYWTKQTT